MKHLYPYERVSWKNGSVITEEHFIMLENWIEDQFSFYTQLIPNSSGLFKHYSLMDEFNNTDSIHFTRLDNILWRVEIRNFSGLTSAGEHIVIRDRISYDFRIKKSDQDHSGNLSIYLSSTQESGSHNEDFIEEGQIITTTKKYSVSTTPNPSHGIPIARFLLKGDNVVVDDSYIIPFVTMSSSHSALWYKRKINEANSELSYSLKKYINAITTNNELMKYWNFTANSLRFVHQFGLNIEEHSNIMFALLRQETRKLFMGIYDELFFLSLYPGQDNLFHRFQEVRDVLQYFTEDREYDVRDADVVLGKTLQSYKSITEFLSYLPLGPEKQQQIPLKDISISQVPTGNKIVLYFTKRENFTRHKTQLSIKLSEFKVGIPIREGIKVGLNPLLPFGGLEDITQHLQNLPDINGYLLEIPTHLVDRDMTDAIVLYLPRPLGEEVNLEKNVAVFVKD